MTRLVGVGLVVPVSVLVVLGLVLGSCSRGQAVAPEGQAVHLVQQEVGALEAVVVWVVLLLPWLIIFIH